MGKQIKPINEINVVHCDQRRQRLTLSKAEVEFLNDEFSLSPARLI